MATHCAMDNNTLLGTRRPIAQQIERAWNVHKLDVHETLRRVELRLQKQMVQLAENQYPDTMLFGLAFVSGMLLTILCIICIVVCYKIKRKKRRTI